MNNITKLFTSVHEKTMEEDGSITIRGYANTVAKDRAGDVIPKSTWEKSTALSNYRKNPIILAHHDYTQPIGKATELNVTDKGLEIVAKISKGAGDVHKLIDDGVLSTFSVGFRLNDAEWEDASDTFLITDLELLEVSVVSVPCNQD